MLEENLDLLFAGWAADDPPAPRDAWRDGPRDGPALLDAHADKLFPVLLAAVGTGGSPHGQAAPAVAASVLTAMPEAVPARHLYRLAAEALPTWPAPSAAGAAVRDTLLAALRGYPLAKRAPFLEATLPQLHRTLFPPPPPTDGTDEEEAEGDADGPAAAPAPPLRVPVAVAVAAACAFARPLMADESTEVDSDGTVGHAARRRAALVAFLLACAEDALDPAHRNVDADPVDMSPLTALLFVDSPVDVQYLLSLPFLHAEKRWRRMVQGPTDDNEAEDQQTRESNDAAGASTLTALALGESKTVSPVPPWSRLGLARAVHCALCGAAAGAGAGAGGAGGGGGGGEAAASDTALAWLGAVTSPKQAWQLVMAQAVFLLVHAHETGGDVDEHEDGTPFEQTVFASAPEAGEGNAEADDATGTTLSVTMAGPTTTTTNTSTSSISSTSTKNVVPSDASSGEALASWVAQRLPHHSQRSMPIPSPAAAAGAGAAAAAAEAAAEAAAAAAEAAAAAAEGGFSWEGGSEDEAAACDFDLEDQAWQDEWAKEAVLSRSHLWRPRVNEEALMQIMITEMLRSSQAHKRKALRSSCERVFESLGGAECRRLITRLVRRCPHTQVTGWLLDLARRRIAEDLRTLQLHDQGMPPPGEAGTAFVGDHALDPLITTPLKAMAAELNQTQLVAQLESHTAALALARLVLLGRSRLESPMLQKTVCTVRTMDQWRRSVSELLSSLDAQRTFADQPWHPAPTHTLVPPNPSMIDTTAAAAADTTPAPPTLTTGVLVDRPVAVEPTPQQQPFHMLLLIEAAREVATLLGAGAADGEGIASAHALASQDDNANAGGGAAEQATPADEERFEVGVSEDIGGRSSMEDAQIIVHNLKVGGMAGVDGPQTWAGVYDGHGGHECSEYLESHLHTQVAEALQRDAQVIQATADQSDKDAIVKAAVTRAFQQTDAMFEASLTNRCVAGSTATTTLILGNRLYCANTGDSRSVLFRSGVATALSEDHKPSRRDEYDRIRAAGGVVLKRRVMGDLAVSRAFGDFEYKKGLSYLCEQKPPEGVVEPPLVLVDPEFEVTTLNGETDEFVLLACDGLWDVFDNQSACEFVSRHLTIYGHDVTKTAKALSDEAIRNRHSTDNVTIMILLLKQCWG